MIKLDKVLYTAKTHTTGGREGGKSRTDDGRLEVSLSPPGTSGTGTNPEQLLAAGWSSCFLSALKILAGKKKIALPEVAVDAEIDLGTAQGGYGLAARINASLPGVGEETARALVEEASHICPYSLALHGNIDVKYSVIAS
jgi:osmotically inducible protein OsmC